jgi:hypothetical protein
MVVNEFHTVGDRRAEGSSSGRGAWPWNVKVAKKAGVQRRTPA